MKICTKCNLEKPLGDYHKARKNQSKLRTVCKTCTNQQNREAHHKNRNRNRNSRFKYLYKITLEEYNTMFTAQEGKCLGCKKHQTQLQTRLCVDHCHKTGKVRGLLCNPCNRGLGLLYDSPEILENLIAYLKRGVSSLH